MSTGQDALERLRREIAIGSESLVEALDRLASTELGGTRPDQKLWPYLADVVRVQTDGHPWAQLLIAATLVGIVTRGAPVPIPEHAPDVDELLASVLRAFEERGDTDGEGVAAMVRGNREFGRGRLAQAVTWWTRARELLGDQIPAHELTLAHLSLAAYEQGDLTGAQASADEAAAVAHLRANHEAEGVACIYRAMFASYSGEFSRVEAALEEAEAAFDRVPLGSRQVERPLVHAAWGVLLALRGSREESEGAFARALEIAQTNGIPWFEAVTRALRAEFTAAFDPARAIDDGKRSTEFFSSTGDDWWWNWAVRAQAIAARHTTNFHTSSDLLRRAFARDQNAIERGRTLVELGVTLVEAGEREEALEALRGARRLLEGTGADYWLARTLIALSRADPVSGSQHRAQALALAPEQDPAWLGLVAGGSLEVRVLGQPMVLIADEPVVFNSRRAELAVYALALAEERGIEPRELMERLWPGSASDRSSQRLRGMIWEARRALGPEGWRIGREGERWVLDHTGVCVDLIMARANAATALSERDLELADETLRTLAEPLLAPWAYDDWVMEEARDVENLARELGRIAVAEPHGD